MLIPLTLKLGLAAPLQFMLPHPAPAPAVAVVAVVAPAPAHITPVTTTTTTTVPTAVPGPQPVGPSTTSTETDCVVQWPVTGVNPDGSTFVSSGMYEGNCAVAGQIAAANPGSTITTNTFYLTTTPGETS